MKSMPKNKAPGHNGYTAEFFIASWGIVGSSVISAIKEFFSTGQLLTQVNSTIIALIPKTRHPTMVTEFRPISCCNTICKYIAKRLANRLMTCLTFLISGN